MRTTKGTHSTDRHSISRAGAARSEMCFAAKNNPLSMVLAVCILCAGFSTMTPSMSQEARNSSAQKSVRPAAEANARAAWHARMVALSTPAVGCFVASYPAIAWHESTCRKVPPHEPGPVPVPQFKRAHSPGSEQVGNGPEITASSPFGPITWAEGSFPRAIVQSVATVSAASNNPGAFSLQLNSAPFTSAACMNAKDPTHCQGWAQFVVVTGAVAYAYIEYWLLGFDNPCTDAPPLPNVADSGPWLTPVDTPGDCVFDTPTAEMDALNVASLGAISVIGAAAIGKNDTIIMTTPDGVLHAQSYPDSILGLAYNWKTVEFNIFGFSGRRMAVFNAGAQLLVQIRLKYGFPDSPILGTMSFTGETNNLTLGFPGCSFVGQPPSIQFDEAFDPSVLSFKCPPVLTSQPIKPPPPNFCALLHSEVLNDQNSLLAAQNACHAPDTFLPACEKSVHAAQETLDTAAHLYVKRCSTP
jgi:hypothetical protein